MSAEQFGVLTVERQSLVMIVHGDCESALGAVLTDDVAIELSPNFTGFG